MVCLVLTVCSSDMSTPCGAKTVVYTCNRSSAHMQAVADLLLLASDLHPVHIPSLAIYGDSYPKYRELVVTRTKGLLVLVSRLDEQLHSVSTSWQDVATSVEEMGQLVVDLTECCGQVAYLIATNCQGSRRATPGVVDKYTVLRAQLGVDVCCQHLRHIGRDGLTPALLVQTCASISNCLTVLTDSCRHASDNIQDEITSEQFKLGVRSFTASASCFLASAKCFKSSPTEVHFTRCVHFVESLAASTRAVVNFATEDEFTGKPAQLTGQAMECKKTILGENQTHEYGKDMQCLVLLLVPVYSLKRCWVECNGVPLHVLCLCQLQGCAWVRFLCAFSCARLWRNWPMITPTLPSDSAYVSVLVQSQSHLVSWLIVCQPPFCRTMLWTDWLGPLRPITTPQGSTVSVVTHSDKFNITIGNAFHCHWPNQNVPLLSAL